MNLRTTILGLALGAGAASLGAAVTVTPASVLIAPGEATPFVTVQLTFEPRPNGGTGNLEITPPGALIGHVALEPDPATYGWRGGDISAATQFRLLTAPDAPPGSWTFVVHDETLGAGETTFRLEIASTSFGGSVVPQPALLTLGGAAQTLAVRTLPGAGFSRSVRWEVEGLPAFLHAGPAAVSMPPAYPVVAIELALGARARPGSYSGRVRGTTAGLPPVDLPLTVVVAEPDFTPHLSPRRLELVPGGPPAPVTVSTRARGLESGAVTYEAVGLPPGVVSTGPRASGAPAFPAVELVLSAAPGTPTGSYEARVVGTFRPGGVVREAPLTVVVRPPAPSILGVSPMRIAAGALAQRVAVLGSGFAPGAAVEIGSASVRVVESRVVSPARIELLLDVRAEAPSAAVAVGVTNPDGQAAPQPGLLTVLDGDSLAAPLAVRTVAVLHPLAGAQLGLEDSVRPRGVLAASGSGALVVSWRLDGVPFERSVVQARGGEPVEVAARTPIPRSALGVHELQLVVEGPQELVSEPVPLLQVVARSSALRLLAPEDGAAAVPGEALRLSWTLVPGALGYLVEVLDEEGAVVAAWPAEEADLEAPADDLETLAPGLYRWRVRPRFAADVLGEPSPARTLRLGSPGLAALRHGPHSAMAFSPAKPHDRPGTPPSRGDGFSLFAATRSAPGTGHPLGDARPASAAAWARRGLAPASWPGRTPGFALAIGRAVGAPEEGTVGPGVQPEDRQDWTLGLEGVLSATDGDELDTETAATFAASGAGERLAAGGAELKATAELSLSEGLAGPALDDENRSWAFEGGRRLGRAHGTFAAGYGGPDLLAGAELASPGLATGGARVGLRAGALDIAAYATFDRELQGVVSALEGPAVELSAAALEVGRDRPFRLGVMALEADREGDLFTPGGEGSLLALLAGWTGSAAEVTLEAARSDGEEGPGEGTGAGGRGDALRLGATARAGAWGFELGLRSVDPGFEHPASPGLSLGGVADRLGGDLRATRSWQRGSFGLGLARLESGGDEESGDPEARRSEADLSLRQGLGERVFLTLSTNLSETDSDAAPELYLPAGELEDWRLSLGLQESAGAWSLGQELTLAGSDDALDPARFSESAQIGLDLSRAGPVFGLFGRLGEVRTRSGLDRRETTQWLASLQPSWRLESLGLGLEPYLSWSRTRDELAPDDRTDESYRLTVSWSPARLGRALTLQASGDWSRSRGGLFASGDDGFVGRYTLSLGLRGTRAVQRPAPVTEPDPIALTGWPASGGPSRRDA
jgi:hypothetical protein